MREGHTSIFNTSHHRSHTKRDSSAKVRVSSKATVLILNVGQVVANFGGNRTEAEVAVGESLLYIVLMGKEGVSSSITSDTSTIRADVRDSCEVLLIDLDSIHVQALDRRICVSGVFGGRAIHPGVGRCLSEVDIFLAFYRHVCESVVDTRKDRRDVVRVVIALHRDDLSSVLTVN